MNHTLIFIFLACFCTSAKSQSSDDYKKFHIGTFVYGGKKDVEIIRTKKMQTEVYNAGKSKIIMKIVWLNDSTYMLTVKKLVNAPGCLQKKDWITSVILDIQGNKSICSSRTANCGLSQAAIVKVK